MFDSALNSTLTLTWILPTNTESVNVSGTEAMEYTIEVPSQGENTFSSFLLYLNTGRWRQHHRRGHHREG